MNFLFLYNPSFPQAWNVNWETRHMMIQFEEDNVVFSCLTADCKVRFKEDDKYQFLLQDTIFTSSLFSLILHTHSP